MKTAYIIFCALAGIALGHFWAKSYLLEIKNSELKHQLELLQTNDSELLDCPQIESGYIYQREDSEVIAYPIDNFKIVKK